MKRKLSLILALLIVLSMLPVFGLAETTERRTISIMCAEPTTVEDIETNYATLYLEDRMNADFVWTFLPASEWTTKLELMVTADEKLADILFGTTSELVVAKYGSNGTFIDLTPYYETSTYISAGLDVDPNFRKLVTFADGKIYSVARLQQQTHTDYGHKFFLNQTWLDNLGLAVPTTIDELTEVLRAFRDQDANGNGDPSDEIPITGTTSVQHANPLLFLMGSFTFFNTSNYLQVNDGVINVCYNTDGWREGLRYFASLYEEGLIDPLMFTQDLDQLKAVAQREGDTIVGSLSGMNSSHVFSGNPKMLEYTGTSPFIGPDGTQYAPWQSYSVTHNGFITKDCEDPQLAFDLLDLCWEKEAGMVIRYGEEGVDWEWVPEGTEGIFPDTPATFRVISDVLTGVQNKWWNVWSPLYLDYSIGDGWAKSDDPLDPSALAYATVPKLKGYIPDERVIKIIYTTEESNEIAEIKSNLDSYWKEAMTLFIIGDMDIESEWEDYLAELENIGLSKYLEVTQTAYTRVWGE